MLGHTEPRASEMDVRTVSYVSGGVEQAMELGLQQARQTGVRNERSITGTESPKPPPLSGPTFFPTSAVSSQQRPQPPVAVPAPFATPAPVPIAPVRSTVPPQHSIRFAPEPRTELKFVPPAPLKTPLVRPLLSQHQPQRDATVPQIIPAPIAHRQPVILQQAPFAMDPARVNPGMAAGAQMMRPPANVGPPRTGTPTQQQPPRPGGMFGGPHQPPGVPMPMRPQMVPGAGVPGMQPGMQPRPPPAQGMQRPPMMGQPPPIRPPNPMGGPRPTISPQNSNLGGMMPAGMGPRPPMPMQAGAGGGAGAGLPQGMRPNFYSRPMGPGDASRPPSGTDMAGVGGGPPSATPSVDDDEDVVIGRLPADSSSALNSPNPARVPSRNFTMPPAMEREKSNPSRPPSVAGSYGKPGTAEHELDGSSGRPLHALKDFISKDPTRPGQSPTQSPSPGSQQSLSPANTDENFSYRPGAKPAVGQQQQPQQQQQFKMQPPPGPRPNAPSPMATPGGRPDGDKVTFQIPNGGAGGREGSQEWNARSRPPQPHMIRTGGPKQLTADHKGDNDSGVDEYTQEKDRPNALASPASPLKSPSKIPGLARRPENITSDQSRSRSTSKQRANAKTPETPSEQPLIKKVPMNKIQVGGTPSPNLKVVKSKIGSLENASHKPGGGNVKIETKKIDIKAAPRIEAKNDAYMPKGGDKKIISTKLQWNAKPKIGSMDNASHKPGGGDKRIESIKTDFKERAKPKIGSKDNITYKPGGGDVKIVHQKIDIKAESKIGSLDNLKHKPGGGDKKIFDDKEYLKNIEHPITPSPSTQEYLYKFY
uniref:Microtubule-associated protein n=1 Tax=Anopheles dirus TaxID=7168 RepID=A0A1Y9H1Z4_9DIPT